jgi:hypothetical protein
MGREELNEDASDHRLQWPESVAITAVIALAGMIASGWFNVMLPWVH